MTLIFKNKWTFSSKKQKNSFWLAKIVAKIWAKFYVLKNDLGAEFIVLRKISTPDSLPTSGIVSSEEKKQFKKLLIAGFIV